MIRNPSFNAPWRRSLTRPLAAAAVALVALALAPGAAASAAPSENGCNGLFEVARFATFKNVGDTHGHATVHHQFERHGCAHHNH